MAYLCMTLEVLDVTPLGYILRCCVYLYDGQVRIVLRQGGNVRGMDSLDILADSRVQSVVFFFVLFFHSW